MIGCPQIVAWIAACHLAKVELRRWIAEPLLVACIEMCLWLSAFGGRNAASWLSEPLAYSSSEVYWRSFGKPYGLKGKLGKLIFKIDISGGQCRAVWRKINQCNKVISRSSTHASWQRPVAILMSPPVRVEPLENLPTRESSNESHKTVWFKVRAIL